MGHKQFCGLLMAVSMLLSGICVPVSAEEVREIGGNLTMFVGIQV